jgi:hypothetical protein
MVFSMNNILNNILMVTILVILMGISLSGCKSASPDASGSSDLHKINILAEGFADQLVTEESHRLAYKACEDEPPASTGKCVRRPFELKTKEYCLENKMDEAQCAIFGIQVSLRLIHYNEKMSEESRKLNEKIQQQIQQHKRKE